MYFVFGVSGMLHTSTSTSLRNASSEPSSLVE
jgi:hypothetical protein